VLALVPPGFDTPCLRPANTSYVGPITDPNPRQPLDPRDARLLAEPGDQWVLLSLSTTLQGQAAALPRMLDAVGALPVRVLLTLGGAWPASAVDPPPNVTVIAGLGRGDAATRKVARLLRSPARGNEVARSSI
jgi:UDP:flavonoid glycosyltransferase YjiC (YdhE family)